MHIKESSSQAPKKRKTFFVKLNIYQADHELIKDIAEAKGLTIAEYIHQIAKRDGKRVNKQADSETKYTPTKESI